MPADVLPAQGTADASVLVEARDLQKRFHTFHAVKGVSFQCFAGEVFGLLGPNGAGKTTTIRMLTTILRPTSGTARIAGHDVVKEPAEVRRVIGVLPENAGIRLISSEVSSGEKGTSVVAQILVDGKHRTISGKGNGPVDAVVHALGAELGLEFSVDDYHEHALTAGSEASAAAYVQATGPGGAQVWGVGIHSSILDASLAAVISAANRLR